MNMAWTMLLSERLGRLGKVIDAYAERPAYTL